MKKFTFLCSIVVMAIIGLSVNAEIITGKDGTTYDVLSVAKTNAIGIVVHTTVNSRGQNKAWIPYNNMTPADQQRFGFDQKKYDDYLQKMAEGDKTLADDPNTTPTYRTPKAIGTVTQYVIPQTTTREQYLQRQMQNNPIQGNQASVQGASGVSPVVAAGVNSQAVAVATPATYAGISTQEAKVSMPGATVGVTPQSVGINTPIGNIGVSPYGVAVNTPITNAVVSTNVIGIQTPIAGVYLSRGDVPEPMYVPMAQPVIYNQQVVQVPAYQQTIVPAQIPLVGIPVITAGTVSTAPVVVYASQINAVACPQPVYPVGSDGYVVGPVYANPVLYTGTIQQPVVNYAGAYVPYMSNSGYGYSTFGWSANYGWRYGNGIYPSYWGMGGMGWGGFRGSSCAGGGWPPTIRY